MKVRISDIIINNRKREADPRKVRDLANSIKTIGLLNPVTLTPDLKLLAGLHRTEACRLLGHKKIDAVIKDFDDLKQNLTEIDENLVRAELSILEQGELLIERDEILTSLGLRAKTGDNQWNKKGTAISAAPLVTTHDIALEIGISDRTVRERKQIARGIVPEVKEKLKNTRYADNAHGLLQLTRQPDYIQKIAVHKILGTEAARSIKIDVNEPNIIKLAIKQAHQEYNLQKFKKDAKAFKMPASVTLHCGDFRKICSEMSPSSVDLILCDPLYSLKALSLYRDLGDAAMRVLKPSGYLIALAGTMYLPDVLNHLKDAGLTYRWTGAIRFKQGRVVVWTRGVWSFLRHFVVFYKEPYNKKAKFFDDLIVTEGIEKKHHYYQQSFSAFSYLISRFSKVGDVVLDPCVGSGTTALAALTEKRKCIGIDIDAKAVKVAKARIDDYMKNGQP